MRSSFPCLLVGLALSLTGCPRSEPTGRAERELLLDRAVAADKDWDGILLEFGSPVAVPHLELAWSHGETSEEGHPLRWALGERANFLFESKKEGRMLAWITCEPYLYEGSPTQFIRATVNGETLEPLELRPGRERYPIEIPVKLGTNRFEMLFRYAGSPSPEARDRRRLAVAFYRFDIAYPQTPPVAGQPGPFARVTAGDGRPGLFLPENGALSFFLKVPGGSRLSVELGAAAPPQLLAGHGSRLIVEVRDESGLVLKEVVEATAPRGETLHFERELGAHASEALEISFRVEGRPVFVRPELFAPELAPERRVREPQREALVTRTRDFNILLIVLDGANPLRSGLYGSEKSTTPVLDGLGETSVVFNHAVSQAVYTIASIGSVLTAQYPERHQNVSFADRLGENVATLPGRLSKGGISTVGVAGNAVVSRAFGLDRGYDEFIPVWELDGYTGHGDSVNRAFFEWLDRSGDERFFAYVHFREPHFPYNPPAGFDPEAGIAPLYPEGVQDWSEVEQRNRDAAEGNPPSVEFLDRIRSLYESNFAYVDALVGEILEKLEELGQAEQTIIVVTADHGEAMFEHGYIGHNTQLYEESVRVPLLVKVPGLPVRRVDNVVELIDLAPTILELAGLGDDPAIETMQGKSLVPLLVGDADQPAGFAYSRTLWEKPRYSLRGYRFKLIWDSRNDEQELYDLSEDPLELAPLDETKEEAAFESGFLKQQLLTWLREQEHLRAGAPPPGEADVTQDHRRILESIGYAGHLDSESSAEPR